MIAVSNFKVPINNYFTVSIVEIKMALKKIVTERKVDIVFITTLLLSPLKGNYPLCEENGSLMGINKRWNI